MDRETEVNLVMKKIADHPKGNELLKDLYREINILSVTEILRGTTSETIVDMVERLIIMYELCL